MVAVYGPEAGLRGPPARAHDRHGGASPQRAFGARNLPTARLPHRRAGPTAVSSCVTYCEGGPAKSSEKEAMAAWKAG